ncbi:MAG: RdgB/HAM1 family non-canonical purine NTP pyrophosphatase [Saprospiraceae bacterium]|nr:RdgB/HAM1 family non-canonical purine NTP pyrophosphatase [Saprospiraceae bacterium]
MLPTLLFASQNNNKIIEVQSTLRDVYQIVSLHDVGFTGALEEPFDTFEANAKCKANQGYKIFNLPCFAEDAGLVIDSLDGRPGVWSARYAGDQKNVNANIEKVLRELEGVADRKAHFIAVIAFFDGAGYQVFTGTIHGTILFEPQGLDGFGYDPIFLPDGYKQSFGELPLAVKNRISHRSIAIRQLIDWLRNTRGVTSRF